MIRITRREDLDWVTLYGVAYQDAPLELGAALLQRVEAGRRHFEQLIAAGAACYGVTTGLGKLVDAELDDQARRDIAANMLRARAAAIGEALPRPAVRAMLLIRLVNFLDGRAAVSADLCRFLVERLNDGFTPWVPVLGHGMAGDAIAHTHAFQTLIGEGFVVGADGAREPAAAALAERAVEPFAVSGREGLALVGGVCAAPACAMHAYYRVTRALELANLVAAASMEGLAAPKDSVDPAVAAVSSESGIARVIERLRKHLDHSRIDAHRLQAPVSYRVIPQVHGALDDALAQLRARIENALRDNSDNPLQDGDRLLSVGGFHNQHLVNQVEQVALALAHVGALSERRLQRLLQAEFTGLAPQLAGRPGLDAGLVVAHKAALDLGARLRVMAQPVSLLTGESSAGQEDYMSHAIPAVLRLFDMLELVHALFAYELRAAFAALDLRKQRAGDDVAAVRRYFAESIPPLERDRAPGPEVEILLAHFERDEFRHLWN